MEVVRKKVDEYVDSLAPQIQPRITAELEVFQQKTIDSLEDQVIDAFRSLFKKDSGNEKDRAHMNDSAPDAYGGQSLPFANEIAKVTRSFAKISDEAGDDLAEIFNLTEGSGDHSRGMETLEGSGTKRFLSAALDAVQDHLDDKKVSGGSGFQLDGLLGVISNTVKDAAANPEEKARLISPEIKDKVGAKLREQHASIAEKFTSIALDAIKRWLRSNTSHRDLGDGAKAEIEGQVKDLVKGIGGLFGGKKHASEGVSRDFVERTQDVDHSERGGGFSRVISDKLSTGLAKVHREVRIEFRKILGAIEKELFELLPDQFQHPLEKILGGNPFDSQLDRDAGSKGQRGFGDDIKAKLLSKIRDLVKKVQESLRESILGVVNGGHRKLEIASWTFVQNIVEQKVQKYLPDVKIHVPDDIGNEGVSVGAPTANTQLGQPAHGSQQGNSRPSSSGQHNQQVPQQQNYPPPPQHQQHNYQPDYDQSYQQRPPQYQQDPSQGYGHNQSYPQHDGPPPSDGYQGSHGYQSGQGYPQHQGYGQGQGYKGGQYYGQNPPY